MELVVTESMSKAVFDPTEALHILNSRSSATKQGLIGGICR